MQPQAPPASVSMQGAAAAVPASVRLQGIASLSKIRSLTLDAGKPLKKWSNTDLVEWAKEKYPKVAQLLGNYEGSDLAGMKKEDFQHKEIFGAAIGAVFYNTLEGAPFSSAFAHALTPKNSRRARASRAASPTWYVSSLCCAVCCVPPFITSPFIFTSLILVPHLCSFLCLCFEFMRCTSIRASISS